MSLHLANLPPRIRKDELEHVFRRFGQCTIQLKNGFGFAVYDFRGDAEKALRSLKGRKICGESVYLSWSNNQHNPLQQRFARAARSPEMLNGRNSGRGDNFVGRNMLSSRRDYSTSDKKQFDKGQERPKSSEVHHHRPCYNLKDHGHVHYDRRDKVLGAGGRGDVEPNTLDNGRWEEGANYVRNGTDVNGRMGFDRHKPDRGADKGEKNENRGSDYLAGSHFVGISPERDRMLLSDKKRGLQACFKCGVAGHRIRDCRWEEDSKVKSTYQSDYRHDTKGKSRVGRADSESRSGGRLRSSIKNSRPTRILDTERIHRKLSDPGKDEDDSRNFPMKNDSGREKSKHCSRKRQREINDKFVDTHGDKKSRLLDLSNRHLNYISPKLGTHSRSQKPSVGLISHSRSGSLVPQTISVSPRSLSKSHRSRSIARSPKSRSISLDAYRPRSRSRSKSRSPSSSLSISLGHPLPSSPKKAEVDLNGFSEGVLSPHPKEVPTEVKEHLELEGREENPCTANRVQTSLSGYMDNTINDQLMEVIIERTQAEHDSDTQTSTKNAEVSLNGFMKDDQISRHQKVIPEEDAQFLKVKSMQDNEPPQSDGLLLGENVSSGKVIHDLVLDQLHNDGASDSTAPHISCEIDATCSSFLGKDDKESAAAKMAAEKLREIAEIKSGKGQESTAANMSAEKLREIAEIAENLKEIAKLAAEKLIEIVDIENDNTFEMPKPFVPASNLDLKAPSKLRVGSHLNISAEELSRVLKHYGLEHPEENIKHLDVGDYFGSARLWPWEMIYYRRLKKGPISVENYARRVAQNNAFNITDKYIRSSSGWGELLEEHN